MSEARVEISAGGKEPSPGGVPPTSPLGRGEAPGNVLIIKPSAIGDVVHALPVLNLMRRAWPSARISWLVTPGCAGLLEGHPMLEEVILFDRKGYGAWWRSARVAGEMRRFTRGLRDRRFDLVVDLQGLFRSGWLAWRTGAGRRVGMGYAREGAPWFYSERVARQPGERHAIERYLDVAEALGLGRGPVAFPFHVRADERERVAGLVLGAGRYAVLLPGTNWATKRWPVERFAALGRTLRERFGLASVVAGSAGDEELARAISPDLSLCGKTNLRETVALLEGASVVVANDTGPMHIAAALGRPLVTMYGPTSAVRTGPYGRPESVLRLDLPCSPCLSRTCSHRSCLKWLDEGEVLRAVEREMGVVS